EGDGGAGGKAGLPVPLVVGGDGAVVGKYVVGDLEIVAVADEHAAHRVGGARAVVVDVVAGDHGRVDDGQRDAAAPDELRGRAHGVVERVAQVVVQAVAPGHPAARQV